MVPILVQAILSAGIPVLLYIVVRRSGGSRWAAWVAGTFGLTSYELTRWTLYILTDSVFTTLSALAMAATILSLRSARPAWGWLTGVTTALALFVRPTGWAVVMAVLLAALLWRPRSHALCLAGLVGVGVYLAYLVLTPVPVIVRGISPRGLCTYLISGRVLWGEERYRVARLPELIGRTDLTAGECVRRALTGFPGRSAKIALRKAVLYWTPVYRHYSGRHRIANLVLLGGPMVLALLALSRRPSELRANPLTLVPLLWAVSFTALHALTWVEGDHRFLAPVLPAVYLLAGQGVERLCRCFRSSR
jgi:4-amino-4-deoxy-L-arabinose transferase-like glycosyltransferase